MEGSIRVNKGERGMTLVEVLIASLLLTVGLLAACLTFGAGLVSMHISKQQLTAKQKAREALESVFTARNTQNIVFNQIRNVSDTTTFVPPVAGIFIDGWQAIRGVGADGIASTADDATEPIETITLSGPDNLDGTADDEIRPLTNFQRRVVISNVTLANGNPDPDVRQIVVEVRYVLNGIWRTVRVSSLVSRFA
jgi:prepilin-type N-terminal cleavage/methylation domain-containing protein